MRICFCTRLRFRPIRSAELRQLHALVARSDVFTHKVECITRDVQHVASLVFYFYIVLRNTVDGEVLDTLISTDAVIFVDDVISDGEVGIGHYLFALTFISGALRSYDCAVARSLAFGDECEAALSQLEAAAIRSVFIDDDIRHAAFRIVLLQYLGLDPLFAEQLHQLTCASLGLDRHHDDIIRLEISRDVLEEHVLIHPKGCRLLHLECEFIFIAIGFSSEEEVERYHSFLADADKLLVGHHQKCVIHIERSAFGVRFHRLAEFPIISLRTIGYSSCVAHQNDRIVHIIEKRFLFFEYMAEISVDRAELTSALDGVLIAFEKLDGLCILCFFEHRIDRILDAFSRVDAERKLCRRDELDLVYTLERALVEDVEIADLVDLVSEKVDPYRVFRLRREHVEYSAADGELPLALDLRCIGIAAADEDLTQSFQLLGLAASERYCRIEQYASRHRVLHQCIGDGEYDVKVIIEHAHQHTEALVFPLPALRIEVIENIISCRKNECSFSKALKLIAKRVCFLLLGNDKKELSFR